MMKEQQWEIPNPFLKTDGTEIASPEEWAQQREALAKILAEDLYGEMPPAPTNLQAELVFSKNLWDGGQSLKFLIFPLALNLWSMKKPR